MNEKSGKTLRTVAIVFMGLTAAMNILGGIGTVCAAFLTRDWPSMWAFYDYQLQYQVLMIVTIIIGIICTWATLGLVRGSKRAYLNALAILIVGTIVAGIQFYASLQIRGKATPANMKFFTNAITLVLFLILRLPGIREHVDFTSSRDRTSQATSGGLTAIVVGLILLTTTIWTSSSHTFDGSNAAEILQIPLTAGGVIFTLGGLARMAWVALDNLLQKKRDLIPTD
jgi:prepilin signal peptidase PulO-like enzyme (type II secretory pathway)